VVETIGEIPMKTETAQQLIEAIETKCREIGTSPADTVIEFFTDEAVIDTFEVKSVGPGMLALSPADH
jgi:hypothetical protein